MPHARFENLPQEKRDRILEASAKEFGTHGYQGASLNRVLAAAGISKGAAYYYFEDKADLFDTVMKHYLEMALQKVVFPTEVMAPELFWETIEHWYLAALTGFRETPWMLGLAKACWTLSREEQEGPLLRLREQGRDLMRRAVCAGQQSGAVRSDLPMELLIDLLVSIDQTLDRWLPESIDAVQPVEAASLAARYADCLRRMLEVRKDKVR